MFAAGAARCSPAEGQGRYGVPAGGQYAVIGGAALVPRVRGRVLLFSAKALLECRRLGQYTIGNSTARFLRARSGMAAAPGALFALLAPAASMP
jgi:hypothetical protein